MPPNSIITPELAKHLSWLSRDIGRQLGILLDRRGDIQHVIVGEPNRIYLPELGRHRGGHGHLLRGLRHIHTSLGKTALCLEDISDLTKLRLDTVAVISVDSDGAPNDVHWAHLEPGSRTQVQQHRAPSIHELDVDLVELVSSIETERARQTTGRHTEGKTRAVVVGVYPNAQEGTWRLDELRELAATAGVEICAEMQQRRAAPDPKTCVGKGKLEDVVLRALDEDAELVIFDCNLNPAQARAIAASSDLKVIDRSQLILDIFAQHAQSQAGKLQVELAQLQYNLPRLTDLDAGLSRLTGGIGGRGPGETKLEINRRRARERITRLEREIQKLSDQRQLRRRRRHQSGVPSVAIVGYTNAGKSTLLNRLTAAHVLEADQLFATLDPTSRRLTLGDKGQLLLIDTVGFIRDLPPTLTRAFRATLEEIETTDLLLHVADVSDPLLEAKIETVRETLQDLHLGTLPELLVLNKCDSVEPFEADALSKKLDAMTVSATKRQGLRELVEELRLRLTNTAEDAPPPDTQAMA